MYIGVVLIILLFRDSSHMEAAYGLAITVTMLMTTLLLGFYLHSKGVARVFTLLFMGAYCTIEAIFLAANLSKFLADKCLTGNDCRTRGHDDGEEQHALRHDGKGKKKYLQYLSPKEKNVLLHADYYLAGLKSLLIRGLIVASVFIGQGVMVR
jgi:hypothetical protein